MPPRPARDVIAPPPGYQAIPGQPWNVTPTPTAPASGAPQVSPFAGTVAERRQRMLTAPPASAPVTTNVGDPGWSGLGGQSAAQFTAANNQFVQQYNANLAARGAAGAGGGDPNVANARNQTFGLATGNMNRLENNPVDTEVLAALKARMANGPYNAETVNALQTGAAETQGQETRNAMAQLAKTGLSPSDPAYQSRLNEIQGAQGAAAQQANLGIQQNANIQNYAAAGQAIGQYGGYNTNRNLNINQASNYLGGLYGQVFAPINQRAPQQANYQMPSQQQYQSNFTPAFQHPEGFVGGGGMNGSQPMHPWSPSKTSMSYTAPANNPYVNQGGSEATQQGGSEAASAYLANTGGGAQPAESYAGQFSEDKANPTDKYLTSYLQRTSKPIKTQADAGYSNQAR